MFTNYITLNKILQPMCRFWYIGCGILYIVKLRGIYMSIYKGIFWYVPNQHRLISVKVLCDENGNASKYINYSSKSGENFNHKFEWQKFDKNITNNNPYNYYPRGRVEIKNGKATIFFNPILNRFDIHDLIMSEFGLVGRINIIKKIVDGSKHYEYLIDFEGENL